jgi:hypothetical protein
MTSYKPPAHQEDEQEQDQEWLDRQAFLEKVHLAQAILEDDKHRQTYMRQMNLRYALSLPYTVEEINSKAGDSLYIELA